MTFRFPMGRRIGYTLVLKHNRHWASGNTIDGWEKRRPCTHTGGGLCEPQGEALAGSAGWHSLVNAPESERRTMPLDRPGLSHSLYTPRTRATSCSIQDRPARAGQVRADMARGAREF